MIAAGGSGVGLLSLWFGFTRPVARRPYLTTGLALMALKYLVEATVVYTVAGRVWTPLDYFSPSVARFRDLGSPVLAWAIAAWSIPFVWIGASMTARRALDAGHSARLALLFFVPVLNNLVMLVLATQPTKAPIALTVGEHDPAAQVPSQGPSGLKAASIGILVGILIVAANTAFSTLVLRSYASVLFVGAPFVVGFVTASIYNADAARTLRGTLWLATATIVAAAGAVLLLALEGAVCLAMAFPLALALALVGATLGRTITLRGQANRASLLLLLLALPTLMGVSAGHPPEAAEVLSSIEIDAPPSVVWNNVVSFAELSPPTEWIFRAGIAYPVRARIDGTGVGAVRRCEFSTGSFIEPITNWDPPRRLSFDVKSEPPGMRELSPYDDVHAPHTVGYLRSRQGEFRLIPLPGNRTRLEGSTLYTLQIFPTWYWSGYADALIHRIHMRVLRHIKVLSEMGRREG